MRFLTLFCGLVVQLGAFALFCRGFFPTKVLLTEKEVDQWQQAAPDGFYSPNAKFNKVVFMVVDAMRADFMFSDASEMGFSHWLMNEGFGVGFTAFSNPPTVTLPRLKGITTGSTPNFIDAVLNIAEDDTSSTLGDQDSWIKQMYLNQWKINMFGDDTWLKLFPHYFHTTDGTASFYVSDFTIVDNNVTRHLDHELATQDQWDCMILHYLGLDHIGHKGGASSLNMPAKQREMDAIIEKIYHQAIVDHPQTLFVVMGDHGMNDVGNHGGSSVGETSAAMLLISEQFQHLNLNKGVHIPIPWNEDYDYLGKIDQIDLVPTLAELLGLKVPINNLGKFIPSFLDLYDSEEDKINVLAKNAMQLKVLLDKLNGSIGKFPNMDVESLKSFITLAKSELSKSSSNYNYPDIYTGLALYLALTLASFLAFGLYFKGKFYIAFLVVVFFFTYSANFVASSFVEEEHHMWWFFSTVILTYVSMCAIQKNLYKAIPAVVLFGAMRLMKAWNTSGQKYNIRSVHKISAWLSDLPADVGPNCYLLMLIITLTYVAVPIDMFGMSVSDMLLQGLVGVLVVILGCSKMLSYLTTCFDLADSTLPLPSWVLNLIDILHAWTGLQDYNKMNNMLFQIIQKVWLLLFIMVLGKPLINKYFKMPNTTPFFDSLLSVVTFILISQTNYSNVPLFALMYLILHCAQTLMPITVNSTAVNLFILLMQNSSFFLFGSTNSISTIDLTNSFNGLSSYNMFMSGLLTYVCNWAGPLFWTIASLKLTIGSQDNDKHNKWKLLFDKLIFNFVFYSVSGLMLMVCCYHLRFHLFIWTVFSPKILYFLSWLLCNFLFDSLLCVFITALHV